MKIAVFHELPQGGARRAAEALTAELASQHDISCFCVCDGKTAFAQTKSLKTKVYHFRSGKNHGVLSRLKHDFIDLLLLANLHRRIAHEIDKQKFDLVIVHPSQWTQAPFLLSFLRTPSIYYCQEPLRIAHDEAAAKLAPTLSFPNRFYELINRTWRKILDWLNTTQAEKILCNSKFSRKNIRTAYDREAQVCYLGVDTRLFHPLAIPKKYDLLFLGAPEFIEGYDVLERAKEFSVREWNITVIARNIKGKGISDSELVRKINQSRLVVCLSRNEPFGLTAIEAAACGVPVVAVHEGGYTESVIHQETGMFVDRGPIGLAKTIDELLASPKTLVKLGKQARKNAERNWTWKKSGERLGALLNVKGEAPKFSLLFVVLILGALYTQLKVIAFEFATFRQTRIMFGPPRIGEEKIIGWAQYRGYPLYYESFIFAVLVSLPFLTLGIVKLIMLKKKS